MAISRPAAVLTAVLTGVGALVLLAACGSSGSAAPTTSATAAASSSAGSPSASPSARSTATPTGTPVSISGAAGSSTAQAEQYCEQSGGRVQTRAPYWSTNGDRSQWLALAGSATMCRFQADDEAKSRIYVDLTTLTSPDPTLAGLAYLSEVPMPSSTGGANPATGYCGTELHGSSTFGGAGAAGGGWVAESDPDDVVVALCVFPDGSFIDEWGLAYHSAGEIRGEDLATVMRYQPSGAVPPVFPVPPVRPTS